MFHFNDWWKRIFETFKPRFMQPNTPHCVLTIDDCFAVGGHFYSMATMDRTLDGLICHHSFGHLLTNESHSRSRVFILKKFAHITQTIQDSNLTLESMHLDRNEVAYLFLTTINLHHLSASAHVSDGEDWGEDARAWYQNDVRECSSEPLTRHEPKEGDEHDQSIADDFRNVVLHSVEAFVRLVIDDDLERAILDASKSVNEKISAFNRGIPYSKRSQIMHEMHNLPGLLNYRHHAERSAFIKAFTSVWIKVDSVISHDDDAQVSRDESTNRKRRAEDIPGSPSRVKRGRYGRKEDDHDLDSESSDDKEDSDDTSDEEILEEE